VDGLDRWRKPGRELPDENSGDGSGWDATGRNPRGAALEEGVGAAWTGWIDDGSRGASCRMRTAVMGGGGMRPVAEGRNPREAALGRRVGS
jgi:hypothetical protein